jgi:hypothetical protein
MRRIVTVLALVLTSALGVVHAAAPATPAVTGSASTPCVDKASPHLAPDLKFDPISSSAATLEAFDFPPRPTDKTQLAAWTGLAASYSAGRVWNCNDVPPDAAAIADPGGLNGDISKWVGWAAHNATFTDTDGNLSAQVPFGPADGQAHVIGLWNGVNLGGSAAHPIFQSGVHTETGPGTSPTGCLVLYEGWFPQTGATTWSSATTYAKGAIVKNGPYNDENHQWMSLINGNLGHPPFTSQLTDPWKYWAPSDKQHPMNVPVCDPVAGAPPDYVYAHTTLNGSTATWKIWNVTEDPNQSAVFTKSVVYPPSVSVDGHAEWILENSYTTSLANFGNSLSLYNNRAYAASLGWKKLNDLNSSGYAYNIGPLYEGGVRKALAWTPDSQGTFPVFYCQTVPPQC